MTNSSFVPSTHRILQAKPMIASSPLQRSALALTAAALFLGPALPVRAQSSSLYVVDEPPPAPAPLRPANRGPERLSENISRVSYLAVPLPAPRAFGLQDLVTIIVRESTESDADASLETEKDGSIEGEVSDWPGVRVFDKLYDLLSKTDLDNDPKVGLKYGKKFEGEGEYNRRDTFTTRITARIIDIKPNGTLVLEARKFTRTDDETLNMVLTGTCRQEDIAADNTILSTQLYDLHLVKEHTGELRKTSKKGWITKVFEAVFGF